MACEIAQKIRAQLRDNPNKKTFRKTRQTLLEIAVKLEVMDKIISDVEKTRPKIGG